MHSKTRKVVAKIDHVFRAFNAGMVSFFDRIALVEYVPELSIVVAASQAGVAAVLGLYRGIPQREQQTVNSDAEVKKPEQQQQVEKEDENAKEEESDAIELRVEAYLKISEPPTPLLGLFVSRHVSTESCLTYFRLCMLGHDSRLLCFEMRRSPECNSLSIETVV